MSRYLISGMPRCRTAWLTAVLRAHGSVAYHDVYGIGIPLGNDYGVVDPAVALVTPETGLRVYADTPRLCIAADSLSERLAALASVTGSSPDSEYGRVFQENYDHFARYTHRVHVSELEDNDIVGEIVRLCTKQAPSFDIISTFQLLKIEEHMPKAMRLRASWNKESAEWKEYFRTFRAIQNGTSITPDERPTASHTDPRMTSGFAIVRGATGLET
jgi:hypothetical protein